MKFCPVCSKSAHEDGRYCDNCGYQYTMAAQQQPPPQFSSQEHQQGWIRPENTPVYAPPFVDRTQFYKSEKTNILLLTFLLGWVGGHKFYLGKPIQGLMMVISCWTLIPLCISVLEGVRYVCLKPEELYDTVNRK